jgi:hypothetical protein
MDDIAYWLFFEFSYLRISRAHQELGAISDAQEAVAKGLRRPELQDDMGLANRLIELQTEGRGLRSGNLEGFYRWIDQVLVGNEQSAKMMKGIEGSWTRKVCEAHRAVLAKNLKE